MSKIQVGTKISGGPYHHDVGVVTRYEPGAANCFVIGRSMAPVSGYVDVLWPTCESRHIPVEIVTSLPYRVHDGLATDEEVAAVRAQLAVYQAEQKAKADKTTKSRAAERERLLAQYPHLLRPSEHESTLTCAAKNIRTLLKAAFPRTKFTVRTERYSGGNSINVGWTDGPTTSEVKAITDRFQGGDFDGMTDSYDYRHSVWGNLFGEGHYVFENRAHSTAALLAVCTAILASGNVSRSDWTPEAMAADYDNGRLYNGDEWLRREISEALGYR